MIRGGLKVLCFAPSSRLYFQSPGVWVEPIGLGYVAAAAGRAGHDVRLIDQPDHRFVPDADILRLFSEFRPDVLAFGAYSCNYDVGLHLARACKAIDPAVTVVAGGVHASTAPSVMDDPAIDFVVTGEGEETFVELLARLREGEREPAGVQGLLMRRGGEVCGTPSRPLIADLDALPNPMRDGMCRRTYHVNLLLDPVQLPAFALLFSRGCKGNCSFCTSPKIWRRHVRHRSVQSMVEEIAHLCRLHRMWTAFFVDENILGDFDRAAALCEAILRAGCRFRWLACANLTPIPGDLLSLMARAGCGALLFGLERFNPALQRAMGKVQPFEQVRGTLASVHRHGILIHASFIMGLPGDSAEAVLDDVSLCAQLPIDFFSPVFAAPFFGTRLHRDSSAAGQILVDDVRCWTTREPVMRMQGCTPEDQRRLFRHAVRTFYLRPRYFSTMGHRVSRRPSAALGYLRVLKNSLAGRRALGTLASGG